MYALFFHFLKSGGRLTPSVSVYIKVPLKCIGHTLCIEMKWIKKSNNEKEKEKGKEKRKVKKEKMKEKRKNERENEKEK